MSCFFQSCRTDGDTGAALGSAGCRSLQQGRRDYAAGQQTPNHPRQRDRRLRGQDRPRGDDHADRGKRGERPLTAGRSTTRSFPRRACSEYVFNEEGRVYVTLRVENRAGYDEKEARIDVNRLAPPSSRSSCRRRGYTCSRDGNTRSHRRCRTTATPVTNGIWTTRPYRSPPKGLHLHAHPTGETAPCG